MNTSDIFLGRWDVVEVQHRRRGEWVHEYDFKPGEWTVAFSPEGRHSEIFRPSGIPEEISVHEWSFDEVSGVIRLHSDGTPPEFVRTAVFVETKDETCLYHFDDTPHIRHDAEIIAAHHAHKRWRLVKSMPL
jgi:hypothetical protein